MRRLLPLARILRRVAFATLVLYALCGIALYALQGSLTYHPRPLQFEPDAPRVAIPVPGSVLHGWVEGTGTDCALLYFGGNGEALERDVRYFRDLLPGCTAYLVPYRGFGPNAGTPDEATLCADALAVYDWVHAQRPQVVVMGRSLGSGIATFVASQRPVGRLLLVTPYDSIVAIGAEQYPAFPVAWFMRDRYEAWRHAGAVRASVEVVIAGDDHVIPRSHSDALVARFPSRPAVVVIPGAGHNDIAFRSDYRDAVRAFMAARPSPPVRPR